MNKSPELPLKTSDFESYINKVPELVGHWAGVKALDQIPKKLKVKSFVIVNLSPSSHPGSHWVVLLRPHKDTLELFNSSGCSNLDNVKPYLKFPFKSQIFYNTASVQAPSTSSCGLFCVYFIIHRFLNLDQTFDEVMEDSFKPNLFENENTVQVFCKHVLNLSHPTHLFSLEF